MKTIPSISSLTPAVINRLEALGYSEEALERAICEHQSSLDAGTPAVYCGTYHKYACGSLAGLWIDLTTFASYHEFITFCLALHADESDPELMFQDYEGFPEQYYSECSMSEETFDKILEYVELCDRWGAQAVDAYFSLYPDGSAEDFDDVYCGHFGSEEAFAQHFLDDVYDIDKMMGSLAGYFDIKAFTTDLFAGDYSESNGFVFRCA